MLCNLKRLPTYCILDPQCVLCYQQQMKFDTNSSPLVLPSALGTLDPHHMQKHVMVALQNSHSGVWN